MAVIGTPARSCGDHVAQALRELDTRNLPPALACAPLHEAIRRQWVVLSTGRRKLPSVSAAPSASTHACKHSSIPATKLFSSHRVRACAVFAEGLVRAEEVLIFFALEPDGAHPQALEQETRACSAHATSLLLPPCPRCCSRCPSLRRSTLQRSPLLLRSLRYIRSTGRHGWRHVRLRAAACARGSGV